MQLDDLLRRLKEARDFECLKDEPSHYVKLSRAGEELARVNKKKMELEETIRSLREGAYKELEEKEQSLQKQVKMVQEELDQTQGELARLGSRIGELSGENESRRQQLEEKLQGYVPNEVLEQEVWELLKKQSGQAVINRKKAQVADLEEKEQAQAETLRAARNRYIFAYPAGPFNGAETSNEAYEKLLEKYLTDFEPAYEEEFEKKCASIYKSLRENVIATIHGDIKAAKRHAYEINRLLRETNFSDSTYQIKIEPAKNENGQFLTCLWRKNWTVRIWIMQGLTVRSVSEKMHFIRNMSRRSNF